MIDHVVSAIVRPPRATYSILDLGPARIRFNNEEYWRKDFIVENTRGLKINGSLWTILNHSSQRDTCIIYLPPNSGSKVDAIRNSRLMTLAATTKCNICSIDFAGCGESEGESISLGVREKEDVCAIMSHIMSLGIKRFILWGRSMGAATATMFYGAYKDLLVGTIVAMILDSPFTSLQGIADEYATSRVSRYSGFLTLTAVHVLRQSVLSRCDFDISHINPIAAAPQINIPTVVLSAAQDTVVPPSLSQQLYDTINGPKMRIFFKGTHNSMRPQVLYDALGLFVTGVLSGASPHDIFSDMEYLLQPELISESQSSGSSSSTSSASSSGSSEENAQHSNPIPHDSSFVDDTPHYVQMRGIEATLSQESNVEYEGLVDTYPLSTSSLSNQNNLSTPWAPPPTAEDPIGDMKNASTIPLKRSATHHSRHKHDENCKTRCTHIKSGPSHPSHNHDETDNRHSNTTYHHPLKISTPTHHRYRHTTHLQDMRAFGHLSPVVHRSTPCIYALSYSPSPPRPAPVAPIDSSDGLGWMDAIGSFGSLLWGAAGGAGVSSPPLLVDAPAGSLSHSTKSLSSYSCPPSPDAWEELLTARTMECIMDAALEQVIALAVGLMDAELDASPGVPIAREGRGPGHPLLPRHVLPSDRCTVMSSIVESIISDMGFMMMDDEESRVWGSLLLLPTPVLGEVSQMGNKKNAHRLEKFRTSRVVLPRHQTNKAIVASEEGGGERPATSKGPWLGVEDLSQ